MAERNRPRQCALPCFAQPLEVLGMKDARAIVLGSNLLQGQPGVLERRAIRIERTPLGTQDDDRLRNGVGDSAKLFLVLPQRDLSPLQVIDVGVRSIPSDDVAQFVTQRLESEQEPPILPVVASHTGFDLTRLPRRLEGGPRLHQRVEVIGLEGGSPSPAGGLLWGKTRIVIPSLVVELVGTVWKIAPSQHGDRVNDPP